MWNSRKIAIVGVGGVGGYIGGKLAQKGLDVWFLARSETLRVLKEQGLRVDDIESDFVVNKVKATMDPQEIGISSVIIFAVKMHQLREVAEIVRPMVGPNTILLPIQNGVESHTILADIYGKQNVLGGLIWILSRKVSPGHIQKFSPARIEFGEIDGKIDGELSSRVQELQSLFDSANLTNVPHSKVLAPLWLKMIFVTPLHGVCTFSELNFGGVRSNPSTRKILEDSMQEIINIALAQSILIPDNLISTNMNIIDTLPENATTSMQRDMVAGLPSEFEFLIGAVVRFGKKFLIETPVNDRIYSKLLPREQKARNKF